MLGLGLGLGALCNYTNRGVYRGIIIRFRVQCNHINRGIFRESYYNG